MSTAVAPTAAAPYPVDLEIAYPDRELSRWSTFARPVLALPALLILCLLANGSGLIALPTALVLAARRRYPRWWFDFNRELLAYGVRVLAFVALMDDRQPATEEPQGVAVTLPFPDVEHDIQPRMALVKWLLAIPHYVVLTVLWLAAAVCVIWAWVAILATGRYPRGAFDFVAGVARWQLRVAGYAWVMSTDRYPPFSLR